MVNSGAAFGGTGNEHLSIWSYNDRNELTGSARYADDDPIDPENPVDDEQFSYTYDHTLDTAERRQGQVGNRTESEVGVQSTTTTDYEANSLNQYTDVHTGSSPPVGRFPTYDEDGNMTIVSIAGDMNP
ncbi:MAG: hypothetical protein ABIG44_13965 [Planctomycetota bacterium]